EETVALIAASAGAYFGEVARRALGGAWMQSELPAEDWALVLGGGVRIVPRDLAEEAIRQEDTGEPAFEVPAADRHAVEDALAGKEVPEDEYYSLSGRLEVLTLIADVLAGRRQAAARPETD